MITQKGDFDIEHLIIDDVSVDRNPDIILANASKHNHINAVIRTINRNNLNYAWSYVLNSDYVAIRDGDDRWVDEYKLHKQIAFMSEHPDVPLLGTNAYVLQNDSQKLFPEHFLVQSRFLTFEDLMIGFGMTASTMMLSRSLVHRLSEANHTTPLFDYLWDYMRVCMAG